MWAAAPLVLLLGCSDGGPTDPQHASDVVPLQLSANLSGTPVQTLVVEVTATDIPTPLAYNLNVNNGNATGSIQIPPGSARTIIVRAFDTDGSVTHEGSAIVNVSRGNNPPVQIPLVPRTGHQPLDLTLAEVSVSISPASASVSTGGTVQLDATVIAAGGVLDATVAWATLNPAIASVDASGLVTALTGGTVMIVATYAGVGAGATITVLTGDESFWYADADGDGYGDPANSVFVAIPPTGYVDSGTDCDDADAETNPSAPELLDGKDNDCDGTVDNGFPMLTWYQDWDHDGFGNSAITLQSTIQPAGFVGIAGDCNDSDHTVHPGADESIFPDGIDSDCDGSDA